MTSKKTCIIFFVALMFGVLTTNGGSRGLPTSRRIDIKAKRFQYDPSEITIKKGEPVTLVLHSIDVAHGFKLEEFGVKTDIEKRGDAEVTFVPSKAGDFVGKCSHFCGPGHGRMSMTVHVTE
jgi:cytochrome c oxidase subunit 2